MERKTNLELKHFCKDFKPIRVVLRSIGAKKESVEKQKDYFFNLPKNKKEKIPAHLKLRTSSGKQTLVFYRRPDFSTKNAALADIAFLPIKDKKTLSFLSKSLGIRVIVESNENFGEKTIRSFIWTRLKMLEMYLK